MDWGRTHAEPRAGFGDREADGGGSRGEIEALPAVDIPASSHGSREPPKHVINPSTPALGLGFLAMFLLRNRPPLCRSFGQPVFQSHPHLGQSLAPVLSLFQPGPTVQPNELTPGIPAQDYESRRRKLIDSLPDDSIAVSVSASIKYMSNSQSFYNGAIIRI